MGENLVTGNDMSNQWQRLLVLPSVEKYMKHCRTGSRCEGTAEVLSLEKCCAEWNLETSAQTFHLPSSNLEFIIDDLTSAGRDW